MKRLPLSANLVLLCLLGASISSASASSEAQELKTVTIAVDQAILALVAGWDKNIWLFTPATNPAKSFENLKKTDIDFFGIELLDNVKELYKVLGIQEEVEMYDTGSGQRIMPLVYVTWSMFASSLAARGAARIELVAK